MQLKALDMHEFNVTGLKFDDLAMRIDPWDFQYEISHIRLEKPPSDSFWHDRIYQRQRV